MSGLAAAITNLGGVSWCYDWTSTSGAQSFTPPTGVEFVPQVPPMLHAVHAARLPMLAGRLRSASGRPCLPACMHAACLQVLAVCLQHTSLPDHEAAMHMRRSGAPRM